MDRKEFYTRVATFSPREIDVARLIAQGLSNSQIALRLPRNDGEGHISAGTVKGYIQSLFAKLGVDSRVSVAVLWERFIGGESTPPDRHETEDGVGSRPHMPTLTSPRRS